MSFTWHAQAYDEVSCSAFGTNANSCDQCFNGGSKYVWDAFHVNDVFNAWSRDRLYFDDENPITYAFQTLNSNTTWSTSNTLLQYPDSFVWNFLDNRRVHVFKAGTNERFLEPYVDPVTGARGWIKLQSVANDSVSPNDPAYKLTFISKYRTWWGGRDIGDIIEHRECVFYNPSYCGDGVLDSGDGEVCDPNDPSRTGWGTGGCDTNTCEPVEAPTCNTLTVTPVSGENPLTTTVSCEGFLVNTYEIDCGNGDVFTGNGSGIGTEQFTRECTYTDDATYTPTCTINGNITGPSCRGSVNVFNPTPGITIDKVDQNSADIDGNIGNDTQTIESGDAAIFQITVRNTGGEGLRNVSVSDENGLDCRLTEAQALTRIQAQWNRDNIFDINESFTYMCSTSGVTADYINTAAVVGTWVISGDVVNDTDPTTIVVARDFDLALVKTVVGNDTVFSRGDLITYAITVINQGDIDASGVVVTDYIPTGFTLEDSAWASEWNIASRNIGDIAAGTQRSVNIRLRVGDNVTWSVVNWAEISRDGATGNNTDVDSTPDSNNNNDCHGGLGRDEVDPNSDDRTDGTGDANGNGRCDAGEDEDDHDPAAVVISNAQISIDKTDANVDDLDGIIGTNDRQTVASGERAVFKIRVTNTGTDDLNNIVLTDAIAPNCAGTVTLPSTFPNTWSNIVVGGSGNNANAVLEPGEYVEYTCTRANTTANYTNIATVNADSVVTGTAVPEVSDPTQVIVELPYDLALTKSVNSDNGINFASGDIVTYDITVINQGAVDANDVVITDYIPSALELADDSWTLSGSNATRNVGMIRAGEAKIFSINLRVRDNATNGTVINWAEISSDDGDDVDSTPDSNNDNDCHGGLGRDEVDPNSDDRTDGTGDANGNGTCDAGEDEDDHDPAVITIGNPIFDLALIKEVTGAATSFTPGDIIPFGITVVNQGTADATNVEVTDYIPTDLELADSNWTLVGTNAVRTIANLPAGQSVTLGLNLRVKADATAGDTINWAEISSDEGDDVDSTPDSNNNNDCHGGLGRDSVDPNSDDRLDGTGDANGNGTCDTGEDEDDHDPAVITIVPGVFDLALTKSVTGSSTSFAPGDTLTYDITVINQGTIDATNIVVTDYVPAGMTTAVWGDTFTLNIASLAAGEQVTITTPVFTIAANATSANTINWAEISSADGGVDVDSTPDTDNTNDCHGGLTREQGVSDSDDDRTDGTWDANGNGTCDTGEDEDDHDPAAITIVNTAPSITIDKVDNNAANDEDGSVGNDTQTIDRGDDAIFTITVTNNGSEDLDTVVVTDSQVAACSLSEADALALIQATWNNDGIFNSGESFEYTCTDTNVASSYTNSATVTAVWVESDTPVNDTDTSPVVIDTPGSSSSSSSGGGWTSPSCGTIEINWSLVTCSWNSRVRSYRVDCGTDGPNNEQSHILNILERGNPHTFDCEYSEENPQVRAAQCFVSGNSTDNAQTTRFACQQNPGSVIPGSSSGGGWGWSSSLPRCGNGILEVNETCERAFVEIGNFAVQTPIASEAACRALWWSVTIVTGSNNQCLLPFDDNICNSTGTTNQCKIKTVIPTEPNPKRPNRTVPNQGDIIFSPSTKLIIGTDRLVFDEIGADEGLNLPRILNESDYDLVFDKLCIYREGTSVNSNSTRKCKDIGTLYPYDEVFFTRDEITDYVSSTAGFGANETFRDTKLIVSLFHEGTEYKTAYFASNFDVRVTKPTIVTVWGGTTYVQDTSEVADTKDLGLFVDNANNRNFEWFSVSDNNALSNATDTQTDEIEVVESIREDKVETEDIKVESTAATSNKTLAQATTSYRGIDNVFIVKGNLTIDDASLLENISAPRTYVVEDGNLIINDNIASNQNIAFVVKDGDISIGSSVNSLEGTYISIGGSIGWDTTDERLVVNGSLYGDINPLVASRQYVKSDDEGNLSVWTIVNFGSSIFKKPAPLVGQFVGEYLASSKVAK